MSDTTFLTPQQAAKKAGCGRTRIMKALQNRSLRATQDNRRRWQIKPSDLDRWLEDNPATGRVIDATVTATDSETVELQVKIKGLEVTVEALRDQISDLQNDRNEWRQLAKKLSEPRQGFFARIFQK